MGCKIFGLEWIGIYFCLVDNCDVFEFWCCVEV